MPVRTRPYIQPSVYIGKVYRTVNVELGTEKLDIRDFLMDDIFEGDFITDVSVINLKEPGTPRYFYRSRWGMYIHHN